MARSRARDFFSNFRFHLIDIPPGVDTGEASPFVLSPNLGFQSITAPSMTAEMYEVNAGNQPFPVAIPEGATTDNITLTRGARIGDDEFYRWIMKAIYGRGAHTRNLLLLQIHSPFLTQDSTAARLAEVGAYASAAVGSFQSRAGSGAVGAASAALGGLQAALGSVATVEFPVLAVRAWNLYHCIPTSYKAASDFDANDTDISVQELEIHVESFDEINFGPPTIGLESVGILGA